jgi:hypothetical protein
MELIVAQFFRKYLYIVCNAMIYIVPTRVRHGAISSGKQM